MSVGLVATQELVGLFRRAIQIYTVYPIDAYRQALEHFKSAAEELTDLRFYWQQELGLTPFFCKNIDMAVPVINLAKGMELIKYIIKTVC